MVVRYADDEAMCCAATRRATSHTVKSVAWTTAAAAGLTRVDMAAAV